MQAAKAAYTNNLEFVASGFQACWRNAEDLVSASRSLLDKDFHACSVSLAILALEEMGKLCSIDGLLFAMMISKLKILAKRSERCHQIGVATNAASRDRGLCVVDPRSVSDPEPFR